MADGHAQVRQHLLQAAGDDVDRGHPIVQVKDLTAALDLEFDRLLDGFGVVGLDHGLDGQAIARRCLDHAHFTRPDEREVERARDGRGAHAEHVDVFAEELELLLLAHAEAVLLVDHEQAQVAEVHGAAQQAVRADDDVDIAQFQLAADLGLLAGGAGSR